MIEPLLIGTSPLMQRSSVDLPEPEGPMMQTVSPRRNGQPDVLQHGEGAEGFLDALDHDHGLAQVLARHRPQAFTLKRRSSASVARAIG